MASEMQLGGVTIQLGLTRKGVELVRKGLVEAPREVTPELLAARKKAVAAATIASTAAKAARVGARKKRAVPPASAAEKRRAAEAEKRAAAHAAKAAETAESDADAEPAHALGGGSGDYTRK